MKVLGRTAKLFLIVIMVLATGALLIVASVISSFPTIQEIRGCIVTKMYQLELCPKSANYVRLSEVSTNLQKAVVLTEDSSFWTHQGFDFEEMKRSVEKNIKTGEYKRGGSTITQQLAKNLFLTEEKTMLRKLKEAIITIRLEKVLSKKEILEKYLNVVHLGKNIFGVKAAAEYYFHKMPSQLSVVESAFLTFLLPSPEKYSVSFIHHELTPFAKMRLAQIVDNLFLYQRITEVEHDSAKADLTDFLHRNDQPEDALTQELNAEEETAEPEDD